MKRLSIIFFLLAILSLNLLAQNGADSAKREVPADFKSDGCSLFPDRNYRDCCVEHDKDYYFGGSSKERRQSDNRLYSCVRKTAGWQNKFIAPVMWLGVRVLGVSFLPTPYRWGFGKPKPKKSK